MKLPRLSKKRLLIIGMVVLLSAAILTGGAIYYIRDKNQPKLSPPLGPNDPNYTPTELSVPTDFEALSVDEIKGTYSDPADQYTMLHHYAALKRSVAKYDQAISYLEAAVDLAPDEDQRKNTQYAIYTIALETGDADRLSAYAQVLGQEWLQAKDQEVTENRRSSQGL